MIRVALALAAASLATSAASAEAWKQQGERVSVDAAGISLPVGAGGLSLTKTREASHEGEGIDNVATYGSGDGAIVGTVYVYLPAYGDAALTASATGEAISSIYAPVGPAAGTLVPAGGIGDGAIRRFYTDAKGGTLATGAAFLKAGRWIVKIRVSGPAARAAEVEKALDALIGGVRTSAASPIVPAGDLKVGECPADPKKKAKAVDPGAELAGLVGGNDPMMRALLSSAAQAAMSDRKTMPESIAANGLKPLCVRGRIGKIALLQDPREGGSPSSVIAILNDAGGMLEMRRDGTSRNYALLHHEIGQTSTLGVYNGLLTAAQVGDILSGKTKLKPVGTVTNYRADGKIEQTINVAVGR